METSVSARQYLSEKIKEKTLIFSKEAEREVFGLRGRSVTWFFDFRIPFSERSFLEHAGDLFWETTGFSKDIPIQIGGLESAAIPLVSACVLRGDTASGFYIRKSRKKKMQLRQIEGEVKHGIDIVLVDDLINTGSSFKKQIQVLKKEGFTVKAIFAIVQFREQAFYTFLKEEGIALYTVFTIDDFGLVLGDTSLPVTLKTKWHLGTKVSHLLEQGPKNQIVHHQGFLYKTDDGGLIHKINEDSGLVIWSRQVLWRKKTALKTFRGSCIVNDVFYAATYRGALLALDTKTGSPLYKTSIAQNFTAPLFTLGNKLVTGISEGRGKETYLVVIFDTVAQTVSSRFLLQASLNPSLITDELHGIFYCSDATGMLYALTQAGELVWKTQLSIKGRICLTFNEYGDIVAIAQEGGDTIVLNRKSGSVRDTLVLPAFHQAPPVCKGNLFFGATLDREIYCFNYSTKEMVWSYETTGRMYSSPVLYGDHLYVGDNNGIMHVLQQGSGVKIAEFVVSERIVNPILITRGNIIISTFGDEIYALEHMPIV